MGIAKISLHIFPSEQGISGNSNKAKLKKFIDECTCPCLLYIVYGLIWHMVTYRPNDSNISPAMYPSSLHKLYCNQSRLKIDLIDINGMTVRKHSQSLQMVGKIITTVSCN